MAFDDTVWRMVPVEEKTGVLLLAVVGTLPVPVCELGTMETLLFGVLITIPLEIDVLGLRLVKLPIDGVDALDDAASVPEEAGPVELPGAELVVGDDVAGLLDGITPEELCGVPFEVEIELEADEGDDDIADALREFTVADLVTLPDEAGILLLEELIVPLEAGMLFLGVVTNGPLETGVLRGVLLLGVVTASLEAGVLLFEVVTTVPLDAGVLLLGVVTTDPLDTGVLLLRVVMVDPLDTGVLLLGVVTAPLEAGAPLFELVTTVSLDAGVLLLKVPLAVRVLLLGAVTTDPLDTGVLLLRVVTVDPLETGVLLLRVVAAVPLSELLAGVVDFDMTVAPELLAGVLDVALVTTVPLPELGKICVLDLRVVNAVPFSELVELGEIDLEEKAVALDSGEIDPRVMATVPLVELREFSVLDLGVLTAVPFEGTGVLDFGVVVTVPLGDTAALDFGVVTAVPPDETGVLGFGVVVPAPLEEMGVLSLGVVAAPLEETGVLNLGEVADPLEGMGVLNLGVVTADPVPDVGFWLALDVMSVPLETGVLLLMVATLPEPAELVYLELAGDPEDKDPRGVLGIGVLFFMLEAVPEFIFVVLTSTVPELVGLMLSFDTVLEPGMVLPLVVRAPEPVDNTIGEVDLGLVPVLESVLVDLEIEPLEGTDDGAVLPVEVGELLGTDDEMLLPVEACELCGTEDRLLLDGA
jgi:hypothetical protein